MLEQPTTIEKPLYRQRLTCRSCGSDALETVLSLGDQPLPAWPDSADENLLSPLTLVVCTDCWLVQLLEVTDPDTLWRNADYGYRSGVSDTMRSALYDVVDKAIQKQPLTVGNVVVDIGANDGTLLRFYPTDVVKVAFEPVQRFNTKECRANISYWISDYFQSAGLGYARGSYPSNLARAKIITACAMFYDLDDPGSFLDTVKQVLAYDGLFVLQLSYLPYNLALNDWPNICHEHVCYYSLSTIEDLLHEHGFVVEDLELNSVNGGSLRLYCRTGGRSGPMVYALREWESAMRLDSLATYEDFAARVHRNRDKIRDIVSGLAADGHKIFAYGASTKGLIMLRYCGLGPAEIEAAVERNLAKFGHYCNGSGIPIISEAEARERNPDYMLVLPWFFMDEFRRREKDWHDRGGRFIVPLPEVQVQ